MSEEIKENILSPTQWLRILYMAFFAIVCWVLGIIMSVLIVGQALFSLITGKDNENLRQLGSALSLYFYQILRFLSYSSNDKPFPFSEFQEPESKELKEKVEPKKAVQSKKNESSTAQTGEENEKDASADPSSKVKAKVKAKAKAKAKETEDGDDVFADISFTADKEDETKAASSESDTDIPTLNDQWADTEDASDEDKKAD